MSTPEAQQQWDQLEEVARQMRAQIEREQIEREEMSMPEDKDNLRDLDIEEDTPDPTVEPDEDPADDHRRIPLDNDEDGRWLDPDDPRRVEAEKRLGRLFEEEGD